MEIYTLTLDSIEERWRAKGVSPACHLCGQTRWTLKSGGYGPVVELPFMMDEGIDDGSAWRFLCVTCENCSGVRILDADHIAGPRDPALDTRGMLIT